MILLLVALVGYKINLIKIKEFHYIINMNYFFGSSMLSVGRGCVFTPKPPFSLATLTHDHVCH